MTKIVATSDLHGFLPEIPECDLLLIAGDVCPVWNHDRNFQADWLRGEFSDWMRAQPARSTVWIGGNHDFVLQDWRGTKNIQLPHGLKDVSGIYLDNSWIHLVDDDLKIWGSPMSNTFGRWAFMTSEGELGDIWRTIPRDIDILMVHGPMWGLGDFVPWPRYDDWGNFLGLDRENGEHVGSSTLANQLLYDEWPNLKLVITGHIHEAYGKYSLKGFDIYSNSHVSGAYPEYVPERDPIVIEL